MGQTLRSFSPTIKEVVEVSRDLRGTLEKVRLLQNNAEPWLQEQHVCLVYTHPCWCLRATATVDMCVCLLETGGEVALLFIPHSCIPFCAGHMVCTEGCHLVLKVPLHFLLPLPKNLSSCLFLGTWPR